MNYNISKLFDELVDAWNRHDQNKILSYCDEGIVWRDYSFPQPYVGLEGVRKVFKMWDTAFPDFRVRVSTKLVADDIVAMQMEFTGTHTGKLKAPDMEVAPTNKKITVTGAIFNRFKNGKLIQVDDYPDLQGLLTQLGIQSVHAEEHRL